MAKKLKMPHLDETYGTGGTHHKGVTIIPPGQQFQKLEQELELKRCPVCKGLGVINGSEPSDRYFNDGICKDCNGTGMKTAPFPVNLTDHGFTWGPLTVERTASDKHYGVVLLLKTKKRGTLEIRVTPTVIFRQQHRWNHD